MRASGIIELLHARAFVLGLAYGGVALFVSLIVGLLGRRALDIAGIALVAAAWLAVRGAWGPELASARVAIALLLIAVGGGAAHLGRRFPLGANHPLVVTALFVTPGAALLARVTPLAGSSLSRSVLAIATIAIAVAMQDFDNVHGVKSGAWLLFAITAGGVYLAVPDTELARVLLGTALPFALLSIPTSVCRVGPAGNAAIAGLFSWVVVVGGRGRPGSVVGGLATIGILVAEPVGRHVLGEFTIRRKHGKEQPWILAIAVVALAQLAIALYASRIVAAEDKAIRALFVSVPLAVLAVVLAPMLYPSELPQTRRRHGSSRLRADHHAHHSSARSKADRGR
jgi:hypothetical protein